MSDYRDEPTSKKLKLDAAEVAVVTLDDNDLTCLPLSSRTTTTTKPTNTTINTLAMKHEVCVEEVFMSGQDVKYDSFPCKDVKDGSDSKSSIDVYGDIENDIQKKDISLISQLIDPTATRMDLKYRLPDELQTVDFSQRVSWNKYAPYNDFPPPLTPVFSPPIFTSDSPALCFHIHAVCGRARACTIHFGERLQEELQGVQGEAQEEDPVPGEQRVQRIQAQHRPLPTPMFMPVGTKGCLKALTLHELTTDPALQCPIILANTYHLAIQPGTELVRDMKGLHSFQGLDKFILQKKAHPPTQQDLTTEVLPYNLLTDSGGFQMVSLVKLSQVNESGVSFENPYRQQLAQLPHQAQLPASTASRRTSFRKDLPSRPTEISTDSSRSRTTNDSGVQSTTAIEPDILLLRPEDSIQHQNNIGSNIIMALDDVISSVTVDEQRFVTATHRTLRWYDRCYNYHHRNKKSNQDHTNDICSASSTSTSDGSHTSHQNLFPIVQGGLDVSLGGLREQCLAGFRYRHVDCKYEIPGFAIGGLAGGEAKDDFWKVVDLCSRALPDDKPRYLMGVGYPLDLVVCTALGIDMYDCVYPTRTARFGVALVPGKHPGTLKLSSNKCGRDTTNVIQSDCLCQACRRGISRARLHMLLKTGNPIAVQLITQHNIAYMMALVRNMRQAIIDGTYALFATKFVTEQFPPPSTTNTNNINNNNNIIKNNHKGIANQSSQKDSDCQHGIPTWVVDALASAGINVLERHS